MTPKAKKHLEAVQPERAILARQMQTYLNELQKAAEYADVAARLPQLRALEGVLMARLSGLDLREPEPKGK